MMNMKRFPCFLLIIFLAVAGVGLSLAQQVPPEESVQKEQVVEEQGEIIPSPKDIKESTTIYVFVGWVWLSIIVLIFILRAKIKEVDRLHRIRFLNE